MNIRLLPYGVQTTNIYKDLFKGYILKHLTESFLGEKYSLIFILSSLKVVFTAYSRT